MKESVLDVLMYLFENYMDEDSPLHSDPEMLKTQLRDAGFVHSQIHKAFKWLQDLAQGQSDVVDNPQTTNSYRIFNHLEIKKLDRACRGFILHLEQMGIIDPVSRELIIDRVMALESDEIDLDQLKWVILMVLFNRPGYAEAYSWMETVVLNEMPHCFH